MRFLLLRGLLLTALFGLVDGCARDNGLPGDIAEHFAAKGILFAPIRAQAPISRRDGWVARPNDEKTASAIVSSFGLHGVPRDGPGWRQAAGLLPGGIRVREAWGAWGRPRQFALKNGGQLEYLCLLVADDGWMYIVAAYAYS